MKRLGEHPDPGDQQPNQIRVVSVQAPSVESDSSFQTPVRGIRPSGSSDSLGSAEHQLVPIASPAAASDSGASVSRTPKQYTIMKFFSPGLQKPEQMLPVLSDLQPKKAGPGRPLKVSPGLAEARQQGSLESQTAQQNNEMIRKLALTLGLQNKGGRPPSQQSLLVVRGTVGGSKSNRREFGEKRLRRDEEGPTKLKMISFMNQCKESFATLSSWRKHCCAKFSMQWKVLQGMIDNESAIRKEVQQRKVGLHQDRAKGVHGSSASQRKGKVCRASGAGRRDEFLAAKQKLRAWFLKERAACHFVDRSDLFLEFQHLCLDEAELLQAVLSKRQSGEPQVDHTASLEQKCAQEAAEAAAVVSTAPGFEFAEAIQILVSSMSDEQIKHRLDAISDRLQKLQESAKYAETFRDRLVDAVGGQNLMPSRVSTLSMSEERARSFSTWQQYDHRLYIAAFGTEAELSKLVADPKQFIAFRHQLVLGYSDQVPYWVKIGSGRQVFAEHERQVSRKDRQKNKDAIEGAHRQTSQALPAASHDEAEQDSGPPPLDSDSEDELPDVPQAPPPAPPPAGTAEEHRQYESSGLKRGMAKAEQEKFRITYEARQFILNYFSLDQDPVGVVGKGLLVVHGVHARLCNISESGTWIQDECFEYGGKQFQRKAGHSAGRVLGSYRKVRTEHPELFERLEVMSQPAATVDSVIFKWSLETQAKEMTCSLFQRDMLSAALSTDSRVAMSLANQVPAWIEGGMTPVLQITDTDFSASFKAGVRRAQAEERIAITQAARLKGIRAEFKCGAYEIMKIAAKAHKFQEERNDNTQWVLRSGRNNGHLAFRPDFSIGKLVKSDSQEWASKIPMGSHRIPDEWFRWRYSWLDGRGIPQKPDFLQVEESSEAALAGEAEYCQQEGFMRKLSSMPSVSFEEHHASIDFDLADDQHHEVAAALCDQELPSKIRRRSQLADALGADFTSASSKTMSDKFMRSKRKQAEKVLLAKGIQMLQMQLGKMSRSEALAKMVAKAGTSKGQKGGAGKNLKRQDKKNKSKAKLDKRIRRTKAKEAQKKTQGWVLEEGS